MKDELLEEGYESIYGMAQWPTENGEYMELLENKGHYIALNEKGEYIEEFRFEE